MSDVRRIIAAAFVVFASLIVISSAAAQTAYTPSPENLQARREYQDMKFGMFIHWGVYSVLGNGEWIFHDRKLKVDEYNRLPTVLQSREVRREDLGLARESGGDEIHHDHFAPSRWLRDVRLESFRLEHCAADSV